MTPQVSVIMAACNAERTIDEAIQSVLAQRGVSLELLIGDDASIDRTWERVQGYRYDPRVLVRRLDKHQGVAFLWNDLVGRCRGRYVAMCDADDAMLHGHLSRAVRVFQRHPEVGVVYGDLCVVDGVQRRSFIRRYSGLEMAWDLLRDYLWHAGTVMRRSLILQVGGYSSDLPFMLDYDLFLRLAEITQFRYAGGRARYLYRRHRGSMSDRSQRQTDAVAQTILRRAIKRRYGYEVPW